MKKRFLSLLLCLVLVLGLLPTVAFAEEDHTHCVCGDTACTDTAHGEAIKWTGISSLSEITKAGNYYLKNDVTLSTFWECKIDGVNLCLNGKTVTRDDGETPIRINSGASLAITDCRETAGKIIHEFAGVHNCGTLTLWNGSITSPSDINSTAKYGVVNDGKFTMNGGSITTKGSDPLICGVYNTSEFTMNGGSITDCFNRQSFNGVTVGVVGHEGTFTMTGGSITGNSSVQDCHGVSVGGGGTFTMTGGSITNNTSVRWGAGVSVYGTFTVSGDVNITSNVSGGTLKNGVITGGTPSNVYLINGKNVTVESGKPLADTAKVGITAANPASNPIVVTGTNDTTCFFSDNANYILADNGSNGVKLTRVTVSGVKLLNETGGTEMTGGKTYDGKAVEYDDSGASYTPKVSGVALNYTWQKLNGETYSDLTDAPKEAGSYRLLVSALKNDYNVGTLELAFTVNKAEQTASAKPELDSRTKNSITLKEIPANANGAKAQYRMSDGEWQDNPAFTGLSSGTEYSFTARYAETDNYNASPASEAATFRTDSSGGGGGVSAYTVTVKDSKNGTVTADRKTATSGATVTLTVSPNQGWTLETLTAANSSGKALDLTIVKVGEKYTFQMPGSKVTVEATFMEDNTMLNYFVDVSASDYYYDAVLWAAVNGITSGVDALHFAPDAPCTRGQIVTFLWRASGSPEPQTMSGFADVAADSYCAKAVAWAVERGITSGTGNGRFSPDEACTRAQAVTFLYRAAGSPAVSGYAEFDDVMTDAYYARAVAWATEQGVTEGVGSRRFAPDDTCTRGQIVTFLWRSQAD